MKRLAVVLSQGQSNNPTKRNLEEEIVAQLIGMPGIDVTIIPHLYDLKPDGTGMMALQGIGTDLIVLSWLYPRAAHWLLDRNEIRGQFGVSLLKSAADDDESDESADSNLTEPDELRVISQQPRPQRRIYCIDLQTTLKPRDYVDEVLRIQREANTQVVDLGSWISGTPSPAAAERFAQPTNDTALGNAGLGNTGLDNIGPASEAARIEDSGDRRWYPVIDFSRCTNCMECIDFCLFGVYGVDAADTILVEQPDNCRKGCPACSRVCPENAIIFPQHKSPAIAGADVAVSSLKIDLSKLFGAPDTDEDAISIAARERDEQLMLAGRDAVGTSVGMKKRSEQHAAAPKDELDTLLDQLDDLDI